MNLLVAALAAIVAPAAAAPNWTVDKAHSVLGFSGTVGGQGFNGRFTRWESRIRFDPGNLAGSSVAIAIDTASAATGDKTRDHALPTADWFAAATFPRATFEARRFKALGNGQFQAFGTLTIRGVTRPVALPFRLETRGKLARVTGALTLDRHAFGIGQGQFAGADMVAFPVQVRFSLIARAG